MKGVPSAASRGVQEPAPSEHGHEFVAVIFPGALGDFVCFYPALLALLERYESSAIEIFTRPAYADLLPDRARPITVRSLEVPQVTRLFVRGAAAEEGLRVFFGRFQHVFTWMGSRDPDFLANLRSVVAGPVEAYPFRPVGLDRPMVEYYLSCVTRRREAGLMQATLPIATKGAEWAESFCRSHGLSGYPVLALAPGSGARAKNWSEAGFSRVAEWWQKRTGGVVIVILGPVEEERKTGERMALPPGTVVVRGADLSQLVGLFHRCALYLGNDSGTTHLAAAVGIPTVALFGPTDPRKWKPWGRAVRVLSRSVSCAPCAGETMKVCGHRSCLNDLDPGWVLRTLEQQLFEVTLTNRVPGI